MPKKNLYSGWGKGLHDDTLLDLAYDVAVQAAKSPKPFNLTIITTDNHSPHGMASPRCSTKQKRSSFIGAVECTSKYVAQFVDRILKNKNLHNTDIVIMGDHLFMAIPEQISMFGDNRTIYFKYINSRKDQAKRDQMTHFDVAPSILDSLGLLKDNTQRFGLGYSVFAEIEGFPTHFEQALSLDILSPSIKYDELWRQDSNQNKDNVKK